MWPFSRAKPEQAPDTPGTRIAAIVDRLEQLERKLARLADEQAELEDGIARRLDKYRKRVEREEPATEAHPASTGSRRMPTLTAPSQVLTFDPLAVRRGKGTFPGGSR